MEYVVETGKDFLYIIALPTVSRDTLPTLSYT